MPIIPGTTDPVGSADEVVAARRGARLPAARQGGGRRRRQGDEGRPLARRGGARHSSRRAAKGRRISPTPTVYVERYLEDPRHVEVQVLADAHGNVIHLGERDCTIQRRHQKLVEETPSPAVTPELRERIGRDRSRRGARRRLPLGRDDRGPARRPDGAYYFMEMNTRIQVEHTVTELVTGLDLVREQVLIAAGEPLSLRQEDVVLRGHAIECRINAEDPSNGFLPSPGTDHELPRAGGAGGPRRLGRRAPGSEITRLYDPMIAKLIVHDIDREHARRRMLRALGEFEIGGVKTLVGFHRALLSHPCFVAAETCHGLVESSELAEAAERFSHPATTVAGGAGRLLSIADDDRRGRRPPRRGAVLRARARLPRARAPPARARRRAPARARRRPSSARCRGPCST